MIGLKVNREELAKICRKYRVAAIYVHGSQVKGYAASDSDTDIGIIVSDKAVFKSFEDELSFSGKVEALFELKNPDVRVVDEKASPVFLFEVIKGQLIYERDFESRTDLESRIMRRYYETEGMHHIYRQYLYSNVKESAYAS